jgi:hypothetical protein
MHDASNPKLCFFQPLSSHFLRLTNAPLLRYENMIIIPTQTHTANVSYAPVSEPLFRWSFEFKVGGGSGLKYGWASQ